MELRVCDVRCRGKVHRTFCDCKNGCGVFQEVQLRTFHLGMAIMETAGDCWYAGEFGPSSSPRSNYRAEGFGVFKRPTETRSGWWAGGEFDGHGVFRSANGNVSYELWDSGNPMHSATESRDGSCEFDGERCGPVEPRFADLKKAALDAEAPPTAPPSKPRRGDAAWAELFMRCRHAPTQSSPT
jgi:hypothetical protein